MSTPEKFNRDGTITFTLDWAEAGVLRDQTVIAIQQGRSGGFQNFILNLHKKLGEGYAITLDNDDLKSIDRYMHSHGEGGYQHYMKCIFGRVLKDWFGKRIEDLPPCSGVQGSLF